MDGFPKTMDELEEIVLVSDVAELCKHQNLCGLLPKVECNRALVVPL